MEEKEVHLLSKTWLEKQGYSYKGVCNEKKTRKDRFTGEEEPFGGDVRVPIDSECAVVKIDHMGEKDKDKERLWIEDKGSNNTSTLLGGFTRVCFAVYYGGGNGLLAVPHDMIKIIKDIEEFLTLIAHTTVGKGRVGILDVEKDEHWFY